MTEFLFAPPPVAALAIEGETTRFALRRIFCVGRNYAEHAREMGAEPDRDAPFYFTKSTHHMQPSGITLPYPPGTALLHHEVELVVAIGAEAFRITPDQAARAVFGYGVGLDMTRRDLQGAAKTQARPWDTGKDFDGSAVLAPLTPATRFGAPGTQRIWLEVNGTLRQQARLSDMIHDVPAILADLSRLYRLHPGDLIMTGTPAGVGPVGPGDVLHGGVDGLAPVALTLGPAE